MVVQVVQELCEMDVWVFTVCPLVFLFLKVITLEGWVEIMYYVMDAHSFYNFIYFILLIIVSSFRLLPVLCTTLSKTPQGNPYTSDLEPNS